MEKEIIDVLTLIYSNYELGFYNTTNEMALDLSSLFIITKTILILELVLKN